MRCGDTSTTSRFITSSRVRGETSTLGVESTFLWIAPISCFFSIVPCCRSQARPVQQAHERTCAHRKSNQTARHGMRHEATQVARHRRRRRLSRTGPSQSVRAQTSNLGGSLHARTVCRMQMCRVTCDTGSRVGEKHLPHEQHGRARLHLRHLRQARKRRPRPHCRVVAHGPGRRRHNLLLHRRATVDLIHVPLEPAVVAMTEIIVPRRRARRPKEEVS